MKFHSKIFFVLALVVAISFCTESHLGAQVNEKSSLVVSPKGDDRPNIIFILADDLGYGDLSCFGQKKFKTSHLDKLAKTGLKLTQHYSGSTVCAPSRCALMTGLHTGHCFIRGNREIDSVGQLPIPDETVTVAELLQQAGYVTGAFGKWGLGYPGSEGDPMNQGFDRFYGYNCQRNAHRYFPEYLFDNETQIPLDGKTYSHDLIVEQALEFIRDNKDKPFFCFMPLAIPHAAMEIPEKYRNEFRKEYAQFDNVVGKYADSEVLNPIASFPAMVTHMDNDIGRLNELLVELGIDRETLVVFTSDNGPHQEGGHKPGFFHSSGPFRGVKRDLYEGGIRVPTIVNWPGHTTPGSESSFASAGWDWLPTLCDVAGIKTPAGLDGISLLPTILNENDQPEHEYLYWEFHEKQGRQAVLQGNWKAVRLNVNKNPHGTPELYNLEVDPEEKYDVASKYPEIVNRMIDIMDHARIPSEEFKF